MIFYRQGKSTDFIRLFFICIFITLSPWSYSSLSHPDISAVEGSEVSAEECSEIPLTDDPAEETTLPSDLLTDKVQKSVWRIKRPLSYDSGSAFAIGSNLFITNFHVITDLLKGGDFKDIVLEQEFSSSQLTIKRITRISALYDLVLFETKENVENYLSVTESLPQPEDELFILGYPKGKFQEIKKTGEIIDAEHLYAFFVNNSYLFGTSGAPVLDEKGRVVGVVSRSSANLLFSIKTNDLRNLITGDTALNCSDFIDLALCIKEEVENIEKLADQGDASAQYVLAIMYREGIGVEQNYETAFYWLRRSVDQGNSMAQHALGTMYREGLGVEQDYGLALYWYRKSAEKGNISAQSNIAKIYYEGVEGEVEQDYGLAAYWYRKSASQGSSLAQYGLGTMYREGKGVERNYEMAACWYKRAADQGDISAQFNMGTMHFQGVGVEQDYKLAAYWYKRAADQGDAMAKHNLGTMYREGLGVDRSYEMAAYWYEKSAELGDAVAQYDLGIMYREGIGVAQNDELALEWFKKSALQGYFPAKKIFMIIFLEMSRTSK